MKSTKSNTPLSQAILLDTIKSIKKNKLISKSELSKASRILSNDNWVLLTQSPYSIKMEVSDEKENHIVEIGMQKDEIYYKKNKKKSKWDVFGVVGLELCIDNSSWMTEELNGRVYSREGMIQRVLEERSDKALTSNYKIILADNFYGIHTLINEKGNSYNITIWDFDKQLGYIDNIDWRTNKLCTTKHIIFLCNYLEKHTAKAKRLKKNSPHIEVTLDPLNDYAITCLSPNKNDKNANTLISQYFGDKTVFFESDYPLLLKIMNEIRSIDSFLIRPEVHEVLSDYFNTRMAASMIAEKTIDFSAIKADLYPYQKDGVQFALPKKGVIIADEMGLGKTIQAISIAILKKQYFQFEKTLVICPASIKYQWKSEIEKFSVENALVVDGLPNVRADLYNKKNTFFYIVNYETVLRDLHVINEANFDFVILDEAQKIKNFNTKTAIAIKRIKKQHGLVITGTPVENKLIDLYSIVQFVEPYLLTPLWEFSYQHCIFDPHSYNRILGYYNLTALKKRLDSILIRREKRKVIDQLPWVNQKNIYLSLHEEQARLHASARKGVAQIIHKKFKTFYDWQRLMMHLNTMRMACDSSYLVDKKTFHSTKLVALKHILNQQLDLKNNNRKVIIFSEWVNMLNLIAEMLSNENYGFVMLTGKVPVKKRPNLIKEFESNEECRIFLSTESGGSGLNLQAADVVINFELPWNPAKKNQRIGRIDRLGQQSKKLSVFNLISAGSIEQKIATGLILKQNLFDGVLSSDAEIDRVDFSEKGRSQFIRQLEEIFLETDENMAPEDQISIFQEVIEAEEEITSAQQENEENALLIEEEAEEHIGEESNNGQKSSFDDEKKTQTKEEKFDQLETVLNKGMDFLSGIYKMASGEDLQREKGQSIKVDKETGEVTMKFKIKF